MDLHSPTADRLMEAVKNLKSVEECYAFFEDLCTVKELQDMAQRFETAIRLYEGDNYQNIEKDVGISSATICRVSRCLRYGAGGYRLAIERMKNETSEEGKKA